MLYFITLYLFLKYQDRFIVLGQFRDQSVLDFLGPGHIQGLNGSLFSIILKKNVERLELTCNCSIMKCKKSCQKLTTVFFFFFL